MSAYADLKKCIVVRKITESFFVLATNYLPVV